ncbi:UDP-N-acetylmuramoyl-tripeptide--D-alanyl-D-alanine ligase [Flavobacterium sp. SUN052]|uniref:UDP-N-acetylmuramoyl-tripeptide--D-alanyl-D- alanine ligase n=1 Tax=Flavobacterium sp. SUN052 TaxID=3002441 RepID=UPI00237E628F|nr:UDP-N-acetylmuramoyl-tripeptide--D-alanyl-D-alanine ligase [Flavobacterium sp. SUN052]MEC4004589.1 UDP-N-acetylmuramoyl-tripeptide--D-alanyl-D-alanine ligase [Flavobacterium sp. SUN052]
MTIPEIHNLFLQSNGVVIDTRKIISNSIFIALKGENFDANAFAQEALQKEASYVIIDNKNYYINDKTILVEDSLITLQELAKYHRKYLKNIIVIGLTGSNGKTTTKELIQVVLSKKYNTKATIGNLNNHIGVPLTLLSFTTETEFGIVEMGANHQKEIEFLCEIAQPDYGYITNFGKAHLEGFGGVEGVIKGKSEMYNYLKSNNKKAFVNIDDSIQEVKTVEINRITFSNNKESADIFINTIKANPYVIIEYNNVIIKSSLIGLYNANNINAAITIGNYFNVNNKDIKLAIESYIPDNNRSQIITKNTNEIILDAYNANPSSMLLALENFIQLEKENKFIILGDMFELGLESDIEHQNIVTFLEKQNDIKCFFIGNHFFKNKIKKENFTFIIDFENFKNYLQIKQFQNNTILIKGSRGIALERTLDYI